MSLLLLRSPGGSLFPGILRISASVTPEAAEAAEARSRDTAELAKAALEGNGVPSLLPPLKSAPVAAAELNASPLLYRVAVAVAVGSTELLVFVHKAKAAHVYKTLLSQGKAIAKVTVGAVKDSICTAPLSSFELSLFSSAAFAQAAAAAGWHALNQNTFLSLDPFAASGCSASASASSGDCVVARVLDDGASAAAPDALLVRCRVSASRFRRASFDCDDDDRDGDNSGDKGEIDLSRISASVRGKVACVLPTMEEVLLVDAVPRMEGDGVLVSAWAEAVGGNAASSSSSCSSSFSSSRFWLRAIPRIEVEDGCGAGEQPSFATSEKGTGAAGLVPPAALLAPPALGPRPRGCQSGRGGDTFLLGAFLSALTSPAFSDLWGGKPLVVEGTARLIPRPPAPLFGRPSFGAVGGAAKGAAAAASGSSSFVAAFSWASSSSAAPADAAPAPADLSAAFGVDLNDYMISPLPFDVLAEAADPLTLLSAAAAAAAGAPSSEMTTTREIKKRRPAVEPSLALRSALAAAAAAAASAAAEVRQRHELQNRPSLKASAAMTTTTQTSKTTTKKKLGPMRLPISSGVAAFRHKGVTLVGVRAGEFGGAIFANGMGKKKKGAAGAGSAGGGGGGGGKAPAAAKRKAPAAASIAAAAGEGGESSFNAPAKKAKAPPKAAAVQNPATVAAAIAKVRAAFASGEQTKLTNDELKAFLKIAGKTVGGNKAALMERALGAIGSVGGGGGGAGGGGGPAVEAAAAAASAAPAPALERKNSEEVAAAAAPAPTALIEAAAAASASEAAIANRAAPALEDEKPDAAPLPPLQAALSPVAEH